MSRPPAAVPQVHLHVDNDDDCHATIRAAVCRVVRRTIRESVSVTDIPQQRRFNRHYQYMYTTSYHNPRSLVHVSYPTARVLSFLAGRRRPSSHLLR